MATYRLGAFESDQKPGTFFVSLHDDEKNKITDAPMSKFPKEVIQWFRETLTNRHQKGDVFRVELEWTEDIEEALAMVMKRIT